MFWETIRKKSILYIPVLFASPCLYEAVQAVSVPSSAARNVKATISAQSGAGGTFPLSSCSLLLSPSDTSSHFHLPVNYNYTLMITSEQWGCLWVNGLFARQKLFILLTEDALLGTPCWWTHLNYTCSALALLPWVDLIWIHGFPKWALNPGEERWKKKEGNKILFLW